MISRRSLVTGLSALIATPAVVRASSLMPVRGIIMPIGPTIHLVDPVATVKYREGEWILLYAAGLVDSHASIPMGLISGGFYPIKKIQDDGTLLLGPCRPQGHMTGS